MSICSDSQADLKALMAVRMSPWSNSAKKVLNDISTRHAVGLGSLDLLGYQEMKSLTRGGSALKFVEPEMALGVSRQDVRTIRHCLINQHWVQWQGLGNTQRQVRELISKPCLGAMARFLSFNRTQSRAVIGLLTGHNTMRRHFHLMGLSDIPLCRWCGADYETSAHILCE